MLSFLLFYAMLLILSSFIINGFYSITRGRWEKNPDGSEYWTGKIFKGYHKFLQTHTVQLVSYENEEFLKNFFIIKGFFDEKEFLMIDKNFFVVKRLTDVRMPLFFSYALSKGMRIGVKETDSEPRNHLFAIYKEVKVYKYPEWIRDPLGECINCMASVWGTVLWVFWFYLSQAINETYPTDEVTAFLELSLVAKIFLWVTFCIVLAHLNEYILNLNASLKNEKANK